MSDILDGSVWVISGSGRGIGREIALLAGARGAKVVVNDLGSGPSGEGADRGPAEDVAQAIRSAGGDAVANTDSVADPESAERIVEQAIRRFGRIDVIVNNAGILRDRIFHQMDLVEWQSVVGVHLMGSFYLSRAAAPHFRKQESGAFVHFTSASGLVGNFGQANYSAAKMGIVGLSKSIALDMARYHVRSNAVAPFAWSRLIGTIPATNEAEKLRIERLKAMTPDKIAPLVVFLGSSLAADITGQIFAVRKNEIMLMSQPRPLRSISRLEGWTPESLAQHMAPAFKSSFYPLDRSADVFSWDPV